MVKCVECGFIAIRRTDKQLVEADDEFRESGVPPFNSDEGFPLCFARATNLRAEIEAIPGPGRANKVRLAIGRERDCDDSTPWQMGFSPKEHREALNRERLAEEQQLRSEAEREAEQGRREAERQERTERQRGESEERQAARRLGWGIIVAITLATLVLVSGLIIAAFIVDDSL